MNRSAVIFASVLFVCGIAGVWVLAGVLDGISDAADRADAVAHRADVAADTATAAAVRAERVSLAACKRDRVATDAANRNGAIIYLVLRAASRSPGRMPVRIRTRYKIYSQLPLFRPRPDCDKARADPSYEPPAPQPFSDLPYWKVQQALKRGR